MTTLHEVQRPANRVPGYIAPASTDQVLELLADHGAQARLVAGGTDLMVELDRGAHAGVEVLVDVSRIPELCIISDGPGDLIRLGATVTHNQVVASEPCRRRFSRTLGRRTRRRGVWVL